MRSRSAATIIIVLGLLVATVAAGSSFRYRGDSRGSVGMLGTVGSHRSVTDIGRLPLSFERNEGQSDAPVRFLARGRGFDLFLTRTEAVFRLAADISGMSRATPMPSGAVLEMAFLGAHPQGVRGLDRLPASVNYLVGNPGAWRTGIPTFSEVVYEEAWKGVDLVMHGRRGAPEYDLILSPGADPGRIGIGFNGHENLSLDEGGNLILETAAGQVTHLLPTAYQVLDGVRRSIHARFHLDGDRVGFVLGPHDVTRTVVIDPLVALSYSTFLGGSGDDFGTAIAVDEAGAVFVAGSTADAATDLPTTAGAFDATHNGATDAYVSRLSPAGGGLIYSTFLGGSGDDGALGIDLDATGAAYIGGYTADAGTDFPTTPGAFDTSHNGGMDAFVTKLTPSGDSLVYSTFLGGSGYEIAGAGIVVEGGGSAYVAGPTADAATDFPTTPGAFDTSHNGGMDAFVTKLTPSGDSLVYSTFLGGSGADAAFGSLDVDGAGSLFVSGETASTDFPTTPGAFDTSYNGGDLDAFVTKLTPSGDSLSYSTLLGGSGKDSAGGGVAIDGSGSAYVTGETADAVTDLPTTPGAFDTSHNGGSDAFVTKLTPAGDGLGYSTFLGGSGDDFGGAIDVDGSGGAYIGGGTPDAVTEPPTTPGAFDTSHNGGRDAFVAEFSPSGASLAYSTFLGGSGEDFVGGGIAVDGTGSAYVAGDTTDAATDFPTTSGALDTSHNGGFDAFVAKFVPTSSPLVPKDVTLTGPKAVAKGKKAKLKATVQPCAGHEGDTIELFRGSKKIASGASDNSCTAKFKVKMNKTATFQAVSPQQDADHLAGTSKKLKVRVRKG